MAEPDVDLGVELAGRRRRFLDRIVLGEERAERRRRGRALVKKIDVADDERGTPADFVERRAHVALPRRERVELRKAAARGERTRDFQGVSLREYEDGPRPEEWQPKR